MPKLCSNIFLSNYRQLLLVIFILPINEKNLMLWQTFTGLTMTLSESQKVLPTCSKLEAIGIIKTFEVFYLTCINITFKHVFFFKTLLRKQEVISVI